MPLCSQFSTLTHHPLATINLLSVPTVLSFPESHINGIIQYVAFCICLLSLNIMLLKLLHVVVCISSLFLFIAEQYSKVWMYQSLFKHSSLMSKDSWVVFSLGLF